MTTEEEKQLREAVERAQSLNSNHPLPQGANPALDALTIRRIKKSIDSEAFLNPDTLYEAHRADILATAIEFCQTCEEKSLPIPKDSQSWWPDMKRCIAAKERKSKVLHDAYAKLTYEERVAFGV